VSIRKLLNLLSALALASLTLGHASAEDYELDVTMGEDGLPSEFFYADEHMSVRITVDDPVIDPADGPWYDNTATVEVIVDEAFDPQILSSTSSLHYGITRHNPR
jgi:hypothetical protein